MHTPLCSILLRSLFLLGLQNMARATDQPEATTDSYEVLSNGNVILRGTVLANSAPTNVSFEYGTTTHYGQVGMSSTMSFSEYRGGGITTTLMGLNPGAVYHFRVRAQNIFGTTYGEDMALSPGAPVVVTRDSIPLSLDSEMLQGEVHGWGIPTSVSFEYGPTNSYGSSMPASPSSVTATTPTPVSAERIGLSTAPVYHYRIKAVNARGTTYGADKVFQTGRPTLVALPSTNLSPSGLRMQGNVKLNGQAVVLKFEYGITTAYGTEAIVTVPANASASAQPVTFDLSGNPAFTYHYRLKAIGGGATTYSQDMTTSPLSGRPVANTLPASNIGTSGVTLNGSINANGGTAAVSFQYGPTPHYGSTIQATPGTVTGSSDTVVVATIPTLNVTWHYRVMATNATGTTYGADMVVTVPPNAPTSLPTPTILNIAPSGAKLHGTVNLPGVALVLEYGLTKDYGTTLELGTPATALIGGLAPGSEYHCRYKATTPYGTTTSPDRAFTTPQADPNSPTVITLPASYLGGVDAAVNARVDGKGAPFSGYFNYHAVSSSPNTTMSFYSDLNGSPGDFGVTLSGLQPATTYHFQPFVSNNQGPIIFGEELVFKTPEAGVVAASTQPASEIGTTSARLHGYFRLNGGEFYAPAVFEYGTTPALGQTSVGGSFAPLSGTSSRPVGVYAGSALIPVTGVSVRYYYRLRAKNDRSTGYGDVLSFVTPDPQDATLENLLVKGVSLNEPFLSTTTAYSATVPFETKSATVTATAVQGIAFLTLNNGQPSKGTLSQVVPLQVGINTFSLEITSGNGFEQQAFTLVITREPLKAGSVDASFGVAGQVITDGGNLGTELAHKTLVQPDGKILLVGCSESSLLLARYLPSGTLDTTFGVGGMVVQGIEGHILQGSSLALQSDGKLLVAGTVDLGTDANFFLQRFLSDGSIDPSFDGSSLTTTPEIPAGDTAFCMTVQGDGKILVGGVHSDLVGSYFVIMRYQPNGTPDSTFNGTGRVMTDAGEANGAVLGIAELNGRIAACGQSGATGALACYTSTGALDPTFNGTGLATLGEGLTSSEAHDLLIQPSGEILVAGRGDNSFLLARFSSNGTLDPSFNGTGIVTTNFSAYNIAAANTLLMQPDGKIIVAGSAANSKSNFALARYQSDGSLDQSFGSAGKVVHAVGPCSSAVISVALQDDGKIIASGNSCSFPSADLLLLRLLGNGPSVMVSQTPEKPLFDGISTLKLFGQPNDLTIVPLTITNTGAADLTGFNISITGTEAAHFTATIPVSPTPVLEPNASLTLNVSFLRGSRGSSHAVLHLITNVNGNNGTYDIPIIGTALSAQELWRQTWFGISSNTGSAADLADADADGMVNLLEYALGFDPSAPNTDQLPQPTMDGDDFVLSFTEPVNVSGIIYGAEWSATLSEPNWQPISDTGTAPQHIFRVSRTDKPLLFMRIRVATEDP